MAPTTTTMRSSASCQTIHLSASCFPRPICILFAGILGHREAMWDGPFSDHSIFELLHPRVQATRILSSASGPFVWLSMLWSRFHEGLWFWGYLWSLWPCHETYKMHRTSKLVSHQEPQSRRMCLMHRCHNVKLSRLKDVMHSNLQFCRVIPSFF